MSVLAGIARHLRPAPHAPPLTDPAHIDATYRHWRTRVLYASFIGYAVYYFCRVNISMAIPEMQKDLGYSKFQIGLVASALQLTYGLGKFGNGILADRSSPRAFMAIGLLLSGVVNIVFGLAHGLGLLVALWALNGWFQSMGFPPGARLMSHWFSPTEHGRIWGVWGCSHQVGTAIVSIAVGYLVVWGWRTAFLVPAIAAILVSAFLWNRLRDVPAAHGLPPVEVYRSDIKDAQSAASLERPLSVKETLFHHVFSNKYIWAIALGNMFLYVARYGALTWAPTFIKETKGISVAKAGWMMALFEVLGIAGILSAGWISDVVFKTRRGPVMALSMVFVTAAMFLFWIAPAGQPWLIAAALAACGFFVYGPLMLASVAAAGLAGKKAAASAAGFSGLWGYVGAVMSGAGAGWAIDHFGWIGGFALFIASGVLSAACFALTWNVGARGVRA